MRVCKPDRGAAARRAAQLQRHGLGRGADRRADEAPASPRADGAGREVGHLQLGPAAGLARREPRGRARLRLVGADEPAEVADRVVHPRLHVRDQACSQRRAARADRHELHREAGGRRVVAARRVPQHRSVVAVQPGHVPALREPSSSAAAACDRRSFGPVGEQAVPVTRERRWLRGVGRRRRDGRREHAGARGDLRQVEAQHRPARHGLPGHADEQPGTAAVGEAAGRALVERGVPIAAERDGGLRLRADSEREREARQRHARGGHRCAAYCVSMTPALLSEKPSGFESMTAAWTTMSTPGKPAGTVKVVALAPPAVKNTAPGRSVPESGR